MTQIGKWLRRAQPSGDQASPGAPSGKPPGAPARAPSSDREDRLEALKALTFRQDHEIRDLEAVQDELSRTLTWLMNLTGELHGAGFQVSRLAAEARALRTPEEAVELRESLRNVLFEHWVAPLQGDERQSLRKIAVLLLEELIGLAGDRGDFAPRLRAVKRELARDEPPESLDSLLVEVRDILYQMAVLRRDLEDERTGLRCMVSDSLAQMQSIALTLCKAREPDEDWQVQVQKLLDSRAVGAAKEVLERRAAGIREEAARLRSVSREMSEMLHRAEERVRALEEALERSRVVLDRDPLTGLSTRAALEKTLRDPAARPAWLLKATIAHPDRIRERYGSAALDRILAAIAERLQVALKDECALYRTAEHEFACALQEGSERDVRALATRVRSLIDQIHFIFRAECVPVRVETDAIEIGESADPVALLAGPGGPAT